MRALVRHTCHACVGVVRRNAVTVCACFFSALKRLPRSSGRRTFQPQGANCAEDTHTFHTSALPPLATLVRSREQGPEATPTSTENLAFHPASLGRCERRHIRQMACHEPTSPEPRAPNSQHPTAVLGNATNITHDILHDELDVVTKPSELGPTPALHQPKLDALRRFPHGIHGSWASLRPYAGKNTVRRALLDLYGPLQCCAARK